MTVDLNGPSGRLEALLDTPAAQPCAAVVLAHAHPQLGGTMRARVLHETTRGLVRAGAAVLRFNFRGVGLSAGLACAISPNCCTRLDSHGAGSCASSAYSWCQKSPTRSISRSPT